MLIAYNFKILVVFLILMEIAFLVIEIVYLTETSQSLIIVSNFLTPIFLTAAYVNFILNYFILALNNNS
jgi:hypothetical protein